MQLVAFLASCAVILTTEYLIRLFGDWGYVVVIALLLAIHEAIRASMKTQKEQS